MRILVTAGPTREYLDDVRYLSNPSSGKMGFACARAARRAGHRVTLVTGPAGLPDPPGCRTVRVTDAREMHRAVLEAWPRVDAVIMTAAVGDYRPARRFRGKLRKGAGGLSIRLVRTPDILKALGARKGRRVLAGFALQVQDAEREALRKYEEKNLDLVVLNSPRSFGADRMDAAAYREGEIVKRFRGASKGTVAAWIVRAVGKIAGERSGPA